MITLVPCPVNTFLSVCTLSSCLSATIVSVSFLLLGCVICILCSASLANKHLKCHVYVLTFTITNATTMSFSLLRIIRREKDEKLTLHRTPNSFMSTSLVKSPTLDIEYGKPDDNSRSTVSELRYGCFSSWNWNNLITVEDIKYFKVIYFCDKSKLIKISLI